MEKYRQTQTRYFKQTKYVAKNVAGKQGRLFIYLKVSIIVTIKAIKTTTAYNSSFFGCVAHCKLWKWQHFNLKETRGNDLAKFHPNIPQQRQKKRRRVTNEKAGLLSLRWPLCHSRNLLFMTYWCSGLGDAEILQKKTKQKKKKVVVLSYPSTINN